LSHMGCLPFCKGFNLTLFALSEFDSLLSLNKVWSG